MGQVTTNLYVEMLQHGPSRNLVFDPGPPGETTWRVADVLLGEPVALVGVVLTNGYSGRDSALLENSPAIGNVEMSLHVVRTTWTLGGGYTTEVVTNENFTVSLRRYEWQLRSFELSGVGAFEAIAIIDPNHRVLETTDADNRAVRRYHIREPIVV